MVIGPNHRVFVSQGVASRAQLQLGAGGSVTQRLELGVRLHQDSIDRDHSEDDFRVENGQLALVPGSNVVTASDDDSALALALHALDAVTWRRLTLTPGLRFELIRTTGKDNRKAISNTEWHPVLIPGAGAYFALTDTLGRAGGRVPRVLAAGPRRHQGRRPRAELELRARARGPAGATAGPR